MRIAQEQIEQVRDAANIVDVVSEYVKLRKRGANYLGLCPFHNEKTPSFNVHEDKGFYKCFGCGKAGDAINFLMEIDSLSFIEAVERLAEKANIQLKNVEDAGEEQRRGEKESLLAAVRAAAVWFFRSLRASQGRVAWDYLMDRGLREDVLKKFGVGYAPDEPGEMQGALEQQGFSAELLEKSGLTSRSQFGQNFERFRGRIVFPIQTVAGGVIGFGARVIPGHAREDQAKYVNSTDSIIYHKSKVLYGLYEARQAIRKQNSVMLVEGYLDVLALHQAGFENVVAASGTALTQEQLKTLQRYTNNVDLVFDADQAGRNAAIRGIELALELGLDVRCILLPAGEDPDSLIRKYGERAFEDAVERRQSFIEAKTQWFKEEGALDDPARAAAAVRSIVESIARIPDPIRREFWIRKLGERFRLQETMLQMELNSQLSRNARTQPRAERQPVPRAEAIEERKPAILSNVEREAIELALRAPLDVVQAFTEAELTAQDFHHPLARTLFARIEEHIAERTQVTPGALLQEYREDEEMKRFIVERSLSKAEESEQIEVAFDEVASIAKMIAQTVLVLKRQNLLRAQREIHHRLRHAQDEAVQNELMIQSQHIAEELSSLASRYSLGV